jgi:hypothetical protein
MHYSQKQKQENEKLLKVAKYYRECLLSLRDYANSSKYQRSEATPMPVMNPADIVLRVQQMDNSFFMEDDVAQTCMEYDI